MYPLHVLTYLYPLNLRFVKNSLTKVKKTVYLRDKFVLEDFYEAVVGNYLDNLHVPHSDVFFVRAALKDRTGILFSLAQVESSMRSLGWRK
jgi:hypothetical protein